MSTGARGWPLCVPAGGHHRGRRSAAKPVAGQPGQPGRSLRAGIRNAGWFYGHPGRHRLIFVGFAGFRVRLEELVTITAVCLLGAVRRRRRACCCPDRSAVGLWAGARPTQYERDLGQRPNQDVSRLRARLGPPVSVATPHDWYDAVHAHPPPRARAPPPVAGQHRERFDVRCGPLRPCC